MAINVQVLVAARVLGSPVRKAVAMHLADCADKCGKGIWPSKARIAAACEVSEKSVQRALGEFVEEGLLIVVHEGGAGPGDVRRYDMDLGRLAAYPEIVVERAAPWRPGENAGAPAGEKGGQAVPLDGEKGDTVSNKGDTVSLQGGHGVPQTVMEPSRNLSAGARDPSTGSGQGEGERDSASPSKGDRSGESREAVERAFKRFAPSWPTYLSSSEQQARNAWNALSALDRERAAEMAAAYVEAVKAEGRTMVCSLGVYLSERRWERLPERPARAAPGPVEFAAWGKGWMAYRLALLEGVAKKAWQPTAMQRGLMAKGLDLTAERLRGEHPRVHALDLDAQAMRGVKVTAASPVPAPAEADYAGYARVQRGSAQWQEWADWHLLRDWPWIEPPKHVEWVFLPTEWPPARGAAAAGGQGREAAALRQAQDEDAA